MFEMQDIHSIGGARLFAGDGGGGGGGGGGGDRRLRPHHHHHHQQGLQTSQALKCPRCDSINTKFCYYNNYNLSQPRHFCKNCRRYWTKGGVLRNVPVGGGCRKTKRHKLKAASAAAVTAAQDRKSSNSHSSSESSSLTAANTTEAVSAPSNQESKLIFVEPPAAVAPAVINQQGGSSDGGLFSAEIGSFTSLIAMSNSTGGGEAMPFEYGSISPFRLNHHDHHDQGHQVNSSWNNQKAVVNPDNRQETLKMEEIAVGGLLDQTAQVDLSVLQDRSNCVVGGFGALGDWQQCGDQGLFDLTNNVDQAYWSQNQWNDQDHSSLYLP